MNFYTVFNVSRVSKYNQFYPHIFKSFNLNWFFKNFNPLTKNLVLFIHA